MSTPRRPLGTRTPVSLAPLETPVRPRLLVAERVEIDAEADLEHVAEPRPSVRGRRSLGLGGAATDES